MAKKEILSPVLERLIVPSVEKASCVIPALPTMVTFTPNVQPKTVSHGWSKLCHPQPTTPNESTPNMNYNNFIYSCPICGDDIAVMEGQTECDCPSCKNGAFKINWDAEFEDGRWKDLTTLTHLSPNPTPDEMRDKLFKAGWKRGPGSSFISPKGNYYRGTAFAFKIFMTGVDV